MTAQLRERVAKVLEEGSVPGITHSIKVLSESEAFFQDPDDPWVKHLEGLCGTSSEIATYGTNASQYDHKMAKAMVILGPGSIAQVRTSCALAANCRGVRDVAERATSTLSACLACHCKF